MQKPIVRPASREDIEAFSSMKNKPTIKAMCMELDGKIVGIGGIAFQGGRHFAFCDLKPEARQYKMTIMRTTKRIFDDARERGIRFVYAEIDPDESGSPRWLSSLGFEPDPRSNRFYRWRADV